MSITLYSTGCPRCEVLKKKLNLKNINFTLCEDVDIMQSKGFNYLPVLEVDNTVMDFSTAVKWVGEQN